MSPWICLPYFFLYILFCPFILALMTLMTPVYRANHNRLPYIVFSVLSWIRTYFLTLYTLVSPINSFNLSQLPISISLNSYSLYIQEGTFLINPVLHQLQGDIQTKRTLARTGFNELNRCSLYIHWGAFRLKRLKGTFYKLIVNFDLCKKQIFPPNWQKIMLFRRIYNIYDIKWKLVSNR